MLVVACVVRLGFVLLAFCVGLSCWFVVFACSSCACVACFIGCVWCVCVFVDFVFAMLLLPLV